MLDRLCSSKRWAQSTLFFVWKDTRLDQCSTYLWHSMLFLRFLIVTFQHWKAAWAVESLFLASLNTSLQQYRHHSCCQSSLKGSTTLARGTKEGGFPYSKRAKVPIAKGTGRGTGSTGYGFVGKWIGCTRKKVHDRRVVDDLAEDPEIMTVTWTTAS